MGGDEAHSRSVGRGGCDEWRRQWHMAREEAMTKCVAVEVLLAERVRSQCGSCFTVKTSVPLMRPGPSRCGGVFGAFDRSLRGRESCDRDFSSDRGFWEGV